MERFLIPAKMRAAFVSLAKRGGMGVKAQAERLYARLRKVTRAGGRLKESFSEF